MKHDEFFIKYGIVLSRRRNLHDKERFVKALIEEFKPLNLAVQGIKERKRNLTSVNVHIGNVERAEWLLVTPYDQPSHRFITRGYHPFRSIDTIPTKFIAQNIVPILLIPLGVLVLSSVGPEHRVIGVVFVMLLIGLTILSLFLYPKGWLNTMNVNRSNSGLYVMYRLAQSLKPKSKIAFVLLDHSDFNRHGELILSRYLSAIKHQPKIVYLDCVGKGDTLIVSSNESNHWMSKQFAKVDSSLRVETKTYDDETIQRSALSRLSPAVNFSVGRLINKHFVIEDVFTSKDIEVDEEVLNEVVKIIKKGLQV